MFSPDNLYHVLRDRLRYSPDTVMLTPQKHGEKSIQGYTFFDDTPVDKFGCNFVLEKSLFNKVIMHDQEVFTDRFIHAYINGDHERWYDASERNTFKHLNLAQWISLHSMVRSFRFPIFCHSELNNPLIQHLEDYGFISCYYWYHALVAAEWYRHWRWHPSCMPHNKSHAPYRFVLYALGRDGTRSYRQNVLQWMNVYKDKILHDWNGVRNISSDSSAIIDVHDAGRSAIHVVAETWFDTNIVYLTEKVFKPMVMSQPFILFAPPGSLRYLRDYGFRTFDQFWSEEYDTETDHSKRMEMVKSLIEKLLAMDQAQWHRMYQDLLPVVAHNRDWFFSNEFQEKCVNECFNNLDQSVIQQKERLLTHPGGLVARLTNDIMSQGLKVPYVLDNLMAGYMNMIDKTVEARHLIKQYPALDFYR